MDANMNTSDENKQDVERRVAEGGVAEGSDAERDIERERGNDQVNEERDEIEFHSEMEEKDVAPFDNTLIDYIRFAFTSIFIFQSIQQRQPQTATTNATATSASPHHSRPFLLDVVFPITAIAQDRGPASRSR